MSRRAPADAAAGAGKDAMSRKSKAAKPGSGKPEAGKTEAGKTGSGKPTSGKLKSGKQGTVGSRALSGIAGAAAAFAARKLITFGWTKITGREPPEHPEDPQVSLREALGWALVLGAGVQAARLLATRMTSGHSPALPAGTTGADEAD
jgi:hypothetical protein